MKQHFAALRRGRYRLIVALEVVAIVGRARGNDRPLKRGEGSDDVDARESVGLSWKRALEQRDVPRLAPQRVEPLPILTQSELDRMPPEHRHERLILEPGHRRVGPGQRRRVGDVDEAHAVARVVLPRRSSARRQTVREGFLLLVARRARLLAVARQAQIVEEMTSELDLRDRHRVVGRDRGHREARGQVPRELVR